MEQQHKQEEMKMKQLKTKSLIPNSKQDLTRLKGLAIVTLSNLSWLIFITPKWC